VRDFARYLSDLRQEVAVPQIFVACGAAIRRISKNFWDYGRTIFEKSCKSPKWRHKEKYFI
jgi:hypothetical protein